MKILYLFIFIVLFNSCHIKEKNIKNMDVGKELLLPYNNPIYLNGKEIKNDTLNLLNAKIKVVVIIQGDCQKCIFDLNNWERNNIIYQLSQNNSTVKFLFFVIAYDKSFFYNYIINDIKISYPLIIDSENSLIEKNQWLVEKQYKCLLLDESNKIMVIGDPSKDKNILKLYKENIEIMLKKNN